MLFNVDAKFLGESVENKTLLEKYGDVNSVALLLGSDLKVGLTTDENNFKERKEHFGENFIPPKMPHSYLYYLAKAFQDFMLIFLICGGVVMFATEMAKDPKSGGIDGVAIIIAVIIIVFVTSINDYTKERKFKDLHKTIKMGNTCSVLRDGSVIEICTKDLVVGDIYLPTYGDQVPADGIIIQQNGLKAEESAITGESDLVAKDIKKNPYILSGTHIMEGSGKALIVAVGYYSQTGRILKLLGAASKETKPKYKKKKRAKNEKKDVNEGKNEKCRSILQEKLTKLALLIGKFGVTAGTLVFLILLIRFCVRTYAGPSPRGFLVTDLLVFLEFLMEGFTVVIVAVPEGLPLAVTLSLAYSVTRMLKDHNLVRQLYSCETMGNATTICSDKTGTLTTNRMTVVQIYILGENITKFTEMIIPDLMRECIILNICINKSPAANIRESNIQGALPIQMGNKTECALLGFLTYLNVNYKKYLLKFSTDSIIRVFPFNSEKKVMSAIIDIGNGLYRLLVKGAPDVLLDKCKYEFVGNSGEIGKISQTSLRNFQDTLSDMACDSLRTILLAYRDIESINIQNLDDEKSLINELTILCVVGIDDPVRADVPSAIKTCIKAGITVRMVTGDNIITARSIAKKCGILGSDPDELILDSEKFNALITSSDGVFDQDLFDQIWPRIRVLARSSPKDKYVLVNGILNTRLKDKQVVAVTGDGTNDAPALKRADVGFAMGLTGTDIAKEASDIIITDDNFASIVRAILWGRNVYDSISKFIQFQLTVNLSAIILSIITTTSYGENVLKPSQLLWVNLVMDTFASLALATDTPTHDLLNRKPYSRNRSLLSTNMVVFIILHSIFQITTILIIVFLGPNFFSIDSTFGLGHYNTENKLLPKDTIHGTLIFNVFVLMQVFNEFNARKVHGERNIFKNIFKNKLFIAIILITIVVQVLIVQFTYKFFHVVPLTFELWLWSIFIGSLVLVYHQLVVINMEFLISIPKRFRIQKGIPSSVLIPDRETQYNAKLLWIRGLKKLQQELRVIQAFKDGLVVKNEFDQGSTDELNESI